jgi:hypothetical protein
MTKIAIFDEMKNEQRGMLRRTRFPRLALLVLVICAMEFLDHSELFRSHFWILLLVSIATATIGSFFITWIDGKRHSLASCKGTTTSK